MQSTLRQWWRREMATWNPRLSMSFNNAKGLLNAPGENNCFLNSAVQVLWHLDVFRRSFRLLSGHVCMSNSCIFCALKVIFTQFQYSDQSSLPPDALRKALAKCFADQQRFQLGHMDDAAECFENILMRIHFHIANQESEDMCNARHCISHQKFAMTVVEQVVCKCGATSEPLPFSQMVYYVSASALVAQAKDCQDRGPEPAARDLFAQLLRTAASQGDYRDCPSNCGERVQIRRSLMNLPDVVSIGLIWDSDHPTQDHIKDVVQSIGTSLRLPDLFHSVVDDRWANSSRLQLVGVVCYYGKHYSTFFFHSKMKRWIYFDDATVRELGTSWASVTDKCCRGHYQPLLLLYSSPNGTPVSVETAPQSTTFLPGQDHRDSVDGGDPGGSGRSRAGPDRRPQYSRGGYSHSSFPSQEPSQRGESQPRDYYQYSTAPRLEIKPTPQHYVSRSPLPSQYQHHPRQDQTWGYQGHKRPEQQQGHQYHNGQVHLQSHQRYDSRDQPMALPSHGRQASYLLAVEQPKQSTVDRVSAGPGHTGVASQSQPWHSGVPSQGQPGHIGVPSQGQPGHSGVPSQIQPGQSAVPSQSQPGHSGVPSQRPLSQPLSNRMAPSGHYVNGMDQVGYSMKPEASDLEQGECALEWQAGMAIGYPQMHPPSPQHGAGNSAHGQVNGYPQHEAPNVYSSTVSRVSTSHSDAIKQNLSSSSPLRQRVNRAHLEALSTITQPLQADLLMHTPVPDSSGNLLIPEKGFASETARTLPSVSVEANHNGIDRDTQSDNEKYDWTLSNSDQYKRRQVPPVGDSGETLNIVAGHQSTRLAKVNEIQRIESFKKGNLGKGRIGADVVRYQFDTGVPPPSPGATNGRAPDSASDVSRTDQSEVEAVNCTGTSPPIDILNAVNHVRENSLTSSGKSFDDINLDPDGSPLHERHSTLSRNRPHSARPFDYGHVKPVVLSRTSNSSPMPPGDSGTARLCSAYPSPDTAQEHRHSRPSSAKQTNVGAYPQWQAGDRQSASANYINRKAVESVLQYQQLRTPQTTGQQRAAQATNKQTGIHSSGQKRAPQASGQQKLQGSGHSVLVGGSSGHRLRAGSNSHSSSSSLDSLPYTDSSHKHLKVVQAAQVKEALKVDIPDTASITSHRDSGYRSGSSGDRNSASSTSSTSMESPSVDGHLNYSQRQHMKSLLGYGYDKSNSSSDSLSSTSGHSSQSYSTVRSGQKLGRIPENGHPSSQHMDGSSSGSSTLSNGSTLQQPSKPLPSQPKRPAPVLNKDATLNFKPGQVPPQCETLCMKAEDLVDQSMVKEKQGDLPLALCLCTQAVTYLQKALNVPNTSTETYIYARMKHNTCVLRSRSLHRRIMMRQESTQSKESSTSDASLEDSSSSSVKDMRVEPKGSEDLILLEVPEQPHEKLKEQIKELYQQPSATGHAGIQESGLNQRASGQTLGSSGQTLGSSGQTQGSSGPTEGSVEQRQDTWMVRSVTDSVLVQHTKPSIRSMKDSSVQSKPNVRTVRDIKQRSAQSKLAAKGEASDSRFMELYGTLPRKAGRKVQRSPSLHSTTGVQDHQFKDAHKGAAVVPASNLARTTARSEICLHNPSLDSRPTTPTPGKINKEHIRQLLVNDMLVRKGKQPIQPNRMEENLLSGRKSPGLNSLHNQNDGHVHINQLLQQDTAWHQQTLHNPDPKQQPHRQHCAPPGGVGTYHATQLSNDSQHSSSYHPGGRHSRHNSSSTLVPSEHSRQNSSSSQQSFGHYSRYDRTEPTHAHHTHNSNSSRERIEYRRPNNSLSTDGREYNRQNSHQSAYSGSGQDRGHDEAGCQGVVSPGGGVGEVEGELSRLSLQQHLDRLQAQQMQMFSNQQQWKAQNQNGLDALSPGVSRPDPSQYAPGGTYMKKSISYGQLTAQPTDGALWEANHCSGEEGCQDNTTHLGDTGPSEHRAPPAGPHLTASQHGCVCSPDTRQSMHFCDQERGPIGRDGHYGEHVTAGGGHTQRLSGQHPTPSVYVSDNQDANHGHRAHSAALYEGTMSSSASRLNGGVAETGGTPPCHPIADSHTDQTANQPSSNCNSQFTLQHPGHDQTSCHCNGRLTPTQPCMKQSGGQCQGPPQHTNHPSSHSGQSTLSPHGQPGQEVSHLACQEGLPAGQQSPVWTNGRQNCVEAGEQAPSGLHSQHTQPNNSFRPRAKSDPRDIKRPLIEGGHKSALSKKKEGKITKSVTFSEHIALIATTEEVPKEIDFVEYVKNLSCHSHQGLAASDYAPLPLRAPLSSYRDLYEPKASTIHNGYDSDYEQNSSDSDSSYAEVKDRVKCHLCHKKLVNVAQVYCENCTFYMSRFQSSLS